MNTETIIQPRTPTYSYFADLIKLTKPTISLLVVITALPTMLMTQEGLPPINVCLATIFGTWLASASAATFNQIIDFEIDQKMKRTRARPVASLRISKKHGIAFGTLVGVISFCILFFLTTPLAAYIAIIANAFYVLFYTSYLKHKTVQNIVIGGAAGAVGPLIGWAALTGTVGWPAWVLFFVIFLWTPPHFWALAIKYKDDYSSANIPMLPSIYGISVTKQLIVLYSLTLFPVVLSLFWFQAAGIFYAISGVVLTCYFIYLAVKTFTDPTANMALFHYSCVYILLLFGALCVDRVLVML